MILSSILITDTAAEDQPLPALLAENIESFKRHHPGLEHRLFRGREIRDFIAAEYGGDILAAYDTLRPYAYKADLARLCLLLKHGGVYADLSTYFLGSWAPVPGKIGVFRDLFFGIPWQVANTIIAAPPGHKAIAKAIELICENVRERYYGVHVLCPTGPVCFGKAIAASCRGEDVVAGDSGWAAQVPGHPGLISESSHAFAANRKLIAVKRKRGGNAPDEIGIQGGNVYAQMWRDKQVYGEGGNT